MELRDRQIRQGGTRRSVVLPDDGRGVPVRVGEDVGRTASKVETGSE
jgi:Flp pilus assembly protein CpaB